MATHKKFLLLTLCFCWYILHPQIIDSIKNNLAKEKNPQQKLQLYKKYTDQLNSRDFNKAIKLISEGISLAKSQNDIISEADFLRMKGDAHYFSGNMDTASVYFFQSLIILEKQEPMLETAKLYNDLGRLYRKTRNFKKAASFYDKALYIYEKLNDDEGLATIYNESGVVFEYQNNFQEAIHRYKKSLEIQEKRGDLVGQGYALEFMGGALLKQKKYAESEEYLKKSLEIRKKTKDEFALAMNYNVLGNLFSEQKKYEDAENYFSKSSATAKKMGYLDLLKENYYSLSKMYKNSEKYDLAYENLELFRKINDSIFAIEKLKQVEELATKYETSEKDKEIIESKDKIFKRNVAVSSLLGLLLLAFIYYRNFQQKKKIELQKEILHQQDLATKAVMNAEDNERKRMAMHLHDGVGQLLTATNMNLQVLEEFRNDVDAFDAIIIKTKNILKDAMAEVRTLSHEIMPNMLIKNSLAKAVKDLIDKTSSPKLHINLKIEGLQDSLDENLQIVMFRVIQECINNTIKHADASEIFIELMQNGTFIQANFTDNGKGFNVKSFKNKSEGMGLENIKTRIEFLKGTFLLSSSEGTGTQVFVKIPIKDERKA